MNCWVNLQRLKPCTFVFPFSHSSQVVSIWRKHDDPYFSIKNLGHGAVKGIISRTQDLKSGLCLSKVKVNTFYLPQILHSIQLWLLTQQCQTLLPYENILTLRILWFLTGSCLWWFSWKHPSGPTLRCSLGWVLCSLDGLTYSQDFILCVCTDSQIFVSSL